MMAAPFSKSCFSLQGRASDAHPDGGLLLDILAVLLHGADEPIDRPHPATEGALRHPDILGECPLDNSLQVVICTYEI